MGGLETLFDSMGINKGSTFVIFLVPNLLPLWERAAASADRLHCLLKWNLLFAQKCGVTPAPVPRGLEIISTN